MTEFLIQDRERFEATRRVQRDEATQNSGMFESVPWCHNEPLFVYKYSIQKIENGFMKEAGFTNRGFHNVWNEKINFVPKHIGT